MTKMKMDRQTRKIVNLGLRDGAFSHYKVGEVTSYKLRKANKKPYNPYGRREKCLRQSSAI